MTKNKTIYVALRMSELEGTRLDYIRQPGETRSSAIRRLINDAWFDQNMAFDAEQDISEWDHCEAVW